MGDEVSRPRHNHLTQMITPGCLACMMQQPERPPAAEKKAAPEPRCPWAIGFGTILHTRCDKPASHLTPGDDHRSRQHRGNGLAEFPYQRISWLPGDSREYLTDRSDTHAWEEESDGPKPAPRV